MNENMIYQNMSQFVFNAMLRGEPREKAVKDAEDILRELVKRTKSLTGEIQKEGTIRQ